MRQAFTFSIFLVAVTACQGQQPDPYQPSGPMPLSVVASVDVEAGQPPLAVELDAETTGGVAPFEFHWSLGDGASADGPIASHVYETLGNYVVEVIVTDAQGRQASGTVDVIAGDREVPIIQATAEPAVGFAPLTVEFHADFGGGTAPHIQSWTFGDGGTDSNRDASHTYNIPGNYVATFTVVDADGDENQFGIPVTVASDETPVVEVSADPTQGEAPLTVQFSSAVTGGNLPLTYFWEFGDGGTSTDPNPTHTYTNNDAYSAKLTVLDSDDDEGTDSVTIVVAPKTATMPELVVSSFGATLSRGQDDFENNDSKSRAFYAGNTNNLPTYPGPYIHPTGLTYYADVTNIGVDITTPFSVGLYHARNNEPVVGASPTQSVTIAALAKNETRRVYFTVPNLSPGNASSWVLADAGGAIAEADELNNTRQANVSVTSDEDWFKVYHPNTDPIDVILTDLAGDYDLYVYGPNGFYGSSTNSGTADEGGTIYPDAAGYWYFRVNSPNGDASATKPYTLWLYPY